MVDELDVLLAEQIVYYRARAREYDATSPMPRDDEARKKLLDALDSFAPKGRTLELACGTGQWTTALAERASELTAVDASPEMLAIARANVGDERVRFIQSDTHGRLTSAMSRRAGIVALALDLGGCLAAPVVSLSSMNFRRQRRRVISPLPLRPLRDGTRHRTIRSSMSRTACLADGQPASTRLDRDTSTPPSSGRRRTDTHDRGTGVSSDKCPRRRRSLSVASPRAAR